MGVRTMATLKDIDLKRKSITNISKITSSMKMVSAAKFARAEKALKEAIAMGPASSGLLERIELDEETGAKKKLIITATSDRGLCGGIHSGVARSVRAVIADLPEGTEYKIATIGDKTRGILDRFYGDKFILAATEIGRSPTTFAESAFIAQEIINSGYEPTECTIIHNQFKNAAVYNCVKRDVLTFAQTVGSAEASLSAYDDIGEDTLRSFTEFNLATNIHYALLQNASSEQSARMTAMENATKNAGEMLEKLNIQFNRTRQAVITTELIEIISGASAMAD